jgi:hypothetical protein
MDQGENEIVLFLKKLLHKCNVVFEEFNTLNGATIPRDILLKNEKLESMEDDIERLKSIFSSSYMTCLHKNASTKQKNPLLNLVRQILRSLGYKMDPFKKANGYTKDGKKIFTRYFRIEKYNNKIPTTSIEDE